MRQLLLAIASLLSLASPVWAGRCADNFYPMALYGVEPLNRCLTDAAATVAGEIVGPDQGSKMWHAMFGYCFIQYEAARNEIGHLTPHDKNIKDWLRGLWTLNYLIYRAMFDKWGEYMNNEEFSSKAIEGYCLDELAGELWNREP